MHLIFESNARIFRTQACLPAQVLNLMPAANSQPKYRRKARRALFSISKRSQIFLNWISLVYFFRPFSIFQNFANFQGNQRRSAFILFRILFAEIDSDHVPKRSSKTILMFKCFRKLSLNMSR